MEKYIIKLFHSFFGSFNPFHTVKLFGAFIAKQHSCKCGYWHFHSIVGSAACDTTVTILEQDNKSSVIPWKKLIFDIESKYTCRFIRVDGIFSKKLLDIDNSSHSIRSDSFLYIAVIKLKGYRLAVVVVTTDFINHRIVGMYIFPQSKLGFTVKIYHFLNVHNVRTYHINHISIRNIIPWVIYSNHSVVLIPAPVFFPRKIIAVQAAMGFLGEFGMKLVKFLIIPGHTPYIAGLVNSAGYLCILYGVCHFVWYNLPSEIAVERYWIRI